MKKNLSEMTTKHGISFLILLGFTLWFAYDIYTLKKGFMHSDIASHYYPYRYWFSQQLLNGNFPLWNPFWGIGQAVEWFLTFPIDIYTPLEIIFGPQYHYFQTFQLLLILLAGFYAFVKLGFKPMVAAAGAILFFMTPWVTYFYFYFMKSHSFIANILLFLFVYRWFETENKKYLFYIIWTTIFSMFGTKAEFWFFNTAMFVFYAFISAIIFYSGKMLHQAKLLFLSMFAIGIGILGQLWQLNILYGVMSFADRTVESTLLNLFSLEIYRNLFLSIMESELLKIFGVGLLFYFGIGIKRWFSWFFLLFGIIAFIGLKIWDIPVIISFIKSPILVGAAIGFFFSLLLSKTKKWIWQDHIKTFLLFLLFVYYWCRPGLGDLAEMAILNSAPTIFKILLSALVWLGCAEFQKSNLCKLAYFSVLFVFFMRDQGQILMTYLAGMHWVPTRDNYTIDFAFTVLAVLGLNTFASFDISNKWRRVDFLIVVAIISIGIITFSVFSNPYYTHWGMMKTPPDYPYYTDVPSVRKVIKELKDSPATRIFIVNKPTLSMTFGFGSCLIEGVGQVTHYSSLVPRNYKDWTFFQRTKIIPEKNWGGYNAEYSLKTLDRLPKRRTMGLSKEDNYFFTLIARPPIERNVLKLLGVKYVVIFNKSLFDERVGYFDLKNSIYINGKIEDLNLRMLPIQQGNMYYNQKSVGNVPMQEKDIYANESLTIGQLNEPLPRAFLLDNITDEKIHEFMNEIDPIVSEQNDFIKTKSYNFHLTPADILRYELENVSIAADAREGSYLVLSDLYHPFWHARIDGKEAEIIPAFYIFRAVKVPAGKHTIDFYYKVPYWVTSIIISLLTIFLSILGAIFYFKFRHHKNYRII